MTIVVENGSGKENAESYASLDEANSYYAKHLYASAWTAATDQNKEAALVMATRAIDAGCEFKGSQVSLEQALEWPRYGVTLPGDGRSMTAVISGRENIVSAEPLEYPADQIPKKLRDAVCEFARFLLTADRDAAADEAEVKRDKVDVIEEEYFQGTRPDIIPEAVVRLLRVLCVSAPEAGGAPSAQAVRMQRG